MADAHDFLTHFKEVADDLGDSLLARLVTVGHDATEEHANALLALTSAELAYQRAFDEKYDDCEEKSHAARERWAEAQAREEWADVKNAKADEVIADKRARFALAALSAMQTQARLEGGQG